MINSTTFRIYCLCHDDDDDAHDGQGQELHGDSDVWTECPLGLSTSLYMRLNYLLNGHTDNTFFGVRCTIQAALIESKVSDIALTIITPVFIYKD